MSAEITVAEKLAIHELLARAAYALDEREMEMLAASFAEDASFSMRIAGGDVIGPFESRDGIMQLMSSSMAEQADKRRHAVSNIFFEADTGEGVVVISNLTLMATENDAIKLLTAGVYRDRVVQRDGVWQLQSRHLDLDKSY
ncbi:nuclear transport factor 2 family protein [Kineobactrum sediminis]|uniref:Nuclear transport factor 2 family protein n=1 Tax=Kineobactrum sediminis TaxID=1905677 RepID=A0A2N5XZJ4_9GAMM|nr:nuclear transport factor 2 family protein [Kineobactrum sediminis]PLW81561.1 nuclear transport factor 2 family protein [Kineobactrum sediminis]